MDPYPGALNGVLSLLFNSTDPQYRYSEQQRAAVPYFHRLKAGELLEEMARKFPQSAELPSCRRCCWMRTPSMARTKCGPAWAAIPIAFPESARGTVSLLMADAHARRNRVQQEFARLRCAAEGTG